MQLFKSIAHCSSKTVLLLLIPLILTMNAQGQTFGLIEYDSTSYNGYTLIGPQMSTLTYLIDNYGRVVHTWESDYTPAQSVYLLENGNLLRTIWIHSSGGWGGGIELLDWDGSVLWHYEYYSDDYQQHHDVEPLPNGNILMLARENISIEDATAAGRNPSTMTSYMLSPEHIIEVEQTGATTGEIVWEWHMWDHLIQDYDLTKPNYGVVEDHPELIDLNYAPVTTHDWAHCNTVSYNADLDQIAISSRHFSEFWVIDHSTTRTEASGHTGGNSGMGGDILYRWGNPLVYRAGTSDDQMLFGQHDVQWIEPGCPGEGNFLMFNNGYGRPGDTYSTVDEVVSPVDGEGNYTIPSSGNPFGPEEQAWLYTANPPGDLLSMAFSGAQRMPNGNTVICSGRPGKLYEVDPEGNVVWRYVNPNTQWGILKQGQVPTTGSNVVFKCRRYAPDYPGLAGRDLTPGAPIEIYPITITETSHLPEEPTGMDSVIVTSTITDDTEITTAELYVDNGDDYFSITMYDDGNHHDGSADDDMFGAVIPPLYGLGTVSYYIYAANDPDSATYDPTIAPEATYTYSVTEKGYICGDADVSGAVDIDDVVYLVAYLFTGGPEPVPYESGEVDCSGAIDIDDVVYIISYLFSGGVAPCDPDDNGVPDC